MTLNTAEKFLLISQHPSKGRFLTPELQIKYGITGAFLLDLALENRIDIEDDRLILKNDRGDSGDSVISEVLTAIRNSQKQRKVRYWINKLGGKYNKYKRSVMDGMEMKNIIRTEHRMFLGLIPYRKYYLTNSIMRDTLIKQIRENILFHRNLTGENVVILGLIEACRMYKIISADRDELKTIKQELRVIIKESPVPETVKTIIKQVQSAIAAAAAASAAASSAASTAAS